MEGFTMEKIKIGIFGASRGLDIAFNFMKLNCDIVAVCDSRLERREEVAEKLKDSVTIYEDFDSFIEHDMDAVVIANYFHEHAPYTIKCFERGLHVYSECISNGTMAEGIELLDAYKNSSSIFMLAENYPQMIFNREIKRICDGGTLGKILFAEGEYNHPFDPFDPSFHKRHNFFLEHWRNFLPRSYYLTHSLGPIMWATGATPKRITCFASFAEFEGDCPIARYVADRVSIITTQNDDGSIFRITGCAAFGNAHNAYRVCGTEGQIENLRNMDDRVMLKYNGWSKPEGSEEVNIYLPKWNDPDEDLIKDSGHGGGDYLTARMFLDCIRNNTEPEHPFDIQSAVNMSSVAILAHRSMLENGKPYDIPDFTKESDRKLYENDRETPFYGTDGSKPTIPCCSHTDYKPTEIQVKKYKEVLGLE